MTTDLRGLLKREKDGLLRTFSLPWPMLNVMTKACRPGTVMFVAGPPSAGKTFWTLNVVKHFTDLGATWMYLPFEDTRQDFARRCCCLFDKSFTMLDTEPEGAEERQKIYERHAPLVDAMTANIVDNPSLHNTDVNNIKTITHHDVIKWCDAWGKQKHVLVIDPLAAIDFGYENQFSNEANFVRRLLAVAAKHHIVIIVNAHTRKRPGKESLVPLGLDDLQGSAGLGRFAQSIIMIHKHPEIASVVKRADKTEAVVTHDRTVTIAKARFSYGDGFRLAFSMDSLCPDFHEHGIIVRKKKDDE